MCAAGSVQMGKIHEFQFTINLQKKDLTRTKTRIMKQRWGLDDKIGGFSEQAVVHSLKSEEKRNAHCIAVGFA